MSRTFLAGAVLVVAAEPELPVVLPLAAPLRRVIEDPSSPYTGYYALVMKTPKEIMVERERREVSTSTGRA